MAPTPPATFSPTVSPRCAACLAVVFATRFTRVTSFRVGPAFRRVVVFRRADDLRLALFARDELFLADVERFLVEDLRAVLFARLADLRVLRFARLDDPERLRADPPLLRRAERFAPDDFLAAMVFISCFGGSPCSVRKNRAQGGLPGTRQPFRVSSTTYQNGGERQ
ncbi:hypothetical protein BH23GEM2_BH23GEM2_00060 [soil metagenome]